MRLLIILFIIFFVFLAFFGNTSTSINNPFISYLFFIFRIILEYFPYFLIGFCVLFLFLIRPYLSRKHLNLKIISHTILQISSVFIIAIISSFLILSLIAFIELNIFSGIINKNPAILGVKTNVNAIKNAIESNDQPPVIITNDKGSRNEVVAIAKASSGTDNFFGNKILTGIPDFLIFPVNTGVNLLFLDNTLIVKEINNEDMQKISSVIGYQIIKNYFPSRNIKSNPKISVMTSDSYGSFRQGDAKNKLARADTELAKINSAISSLSAEIESDTLLIEENETAQEELLAQRDKEYNACLSEGSYEEKVFVPRNTKEFCQQIIEEWEDDFVNEANVGKDLGKNLSLKQARLNEYRFFDEFFNAQKKIIDISASNAPSELGIFEPPVNIRLIINNNSSTAIADYFNTLSHEYLHFVSYIPDKRLDGSFFEEALTEYFAKKAIESTLNTKTNQGYPVLVKVIEEISKKISEPDLAEIYFTKDQAGLEEEINLVYGEDFYKNNIVLFESLLYASDSDQALEIANNIMKKIGGSELRKEDLLSSESKL